MTEQPVGRRITLDPIMEGPSIDMTPRRVVSSIPAGFRVEWVSGTIEDGTKQNFEIGVGAGFGMPWMTLVWKDERGKVLAEEVLNVRDIAEPWLNRVRGMGPTPPELRLS